jgi:hypothetical protein
MFPGLAAAGFFFFSWMKAAGDYFLGKLDLRPSENRTTVHACALVYGI